MLEELRCCGVGGERLMSMSYGIGVIPAEWRHRAMAVSLAAGVMSVAAATSCDAQSAASTPATPPARLDSAVRAVDLDASAEYYRGYRDALRDAARLSRPYYRSRYRARTPAERQPSQGQEAARVWPAQPLLPASPAASGSQRLSAGSGDRPSYPLPMPSSGASYLVAPPQAMHSISPQAALPPVQAQALPQGSGPSDRPR